MAVPSDPSSDEPALRGRFAPSPTGALHFGSLVAALASYLDARHRGGEWLVRIEDLDPPREVPGAAGDILRALETLGMAWDGSVRYQSHERDRYADALERLVSVGHVYPCACSRREIADSALPGIDAPIYPGTCRSGLAPGRRARAWRIRARDADIVFQDRVQGRVRQNVAQAVGDFVLKRADGYFAYQLAVVLDDADQAITDVVRGADLLDSTARQIMLQQVLGLCTPRYAHIPVAVDASGQKLSKRSFAAALDLRAPHAELVRALRFLGQSPPRELGREPPETILNWAMRNWNVQALPRRRSLPALGALQ